MARILKPEYLAIVVAVLALLVSLFDPFVALTAKSRIVIGLPTSVQLSTELGHLILRAKLSLSNIGNATGEFSRVDCIVKNKNSGSIREMKVVSIQLGAERTQFTMNLLEASSSFLNFLNCFGELTEQEIDRAENLIRDANRELRATGLGCERQFGPSPFKLSEALKSDLISNFDDSFQLVEGDYSLTVIARDAEGEELSRASSDFVLSQAAVDELQRAKEGYAHSIGVSCPANEVGSVFIRLKQ